MYEPREICSVDIYAYIEGRATRSLTKQKFMDSVEFSSPFHRLVEHARRRRGCCNSCSNFTSKLAARNQNWSLRWRALYRSAAYRRTRADWCKTWERIALLNVRSNDKKKNCYPARRTYCRRHASESAPPSSMTFIVEIHGRDSDKRARWMHGDRFSRARSHRSREKNELNTVRVGKIRRVIYDLIRCGWNYLFPSLPLLPLKFLFWHWPKIEI